MKARKFFMKAMNRIPNDIERQVNLSMSVSDKIADILKGRGMTQKDLQKAWGVQKQKYQDGLEERIILHFLQ